MDSPITISSSSSTLDPDEADWESTEQDLDWGDLEEVEEDSGRPAKKQRVRGPDDTTPRDRSVAPVASLGPNSPSSQDASRIIAQPVHDDTPSLGDDAVLTHIIEVFPDISLRYVKELLIKHKTAFNIANSQVPLSMREQVNGAILDDILDNPSYPKQEKATKRKRECEKDEDDKEWDRTAPLQGNYFSYSQAAIGLLANEFPTIPMNHIRKVFNQKKRLYPTFVALFSDDNILNQAERTFARLKKGRVHPSVSHSLAHDQGPHAALLASELELAKKKARKLDKKREDEEAEKRNEEEHIRTGNLIECQCCFLEVPANRSFPCDGTEIHFFCFTCIRKSAESQIGLMKYTLQCFDSSGCQASFDRSQLREILGSSVMEKLDSLQQQDEIRKASIDGLEDCPFCSFKAVCPPVEEDREFRCGNPECEIVSCRLCQETTHIPMSCAEAKKEKGISERHEVEEAMSKALIRNCPKCQVKIIKDSGCNKLSCPNCHTAMCYICKKDITRETYGHFRRPGGCPQDDFRAQELDRRDIQEAEQAAIQKILAENPDLTENDLRVKLPNEPPRNPYAAHFHQHMIPPQPFPFGPPPRAQRPGAMFVPQNMYYPAHGVPYNQQMQAAFQAGLNRFAQAPIANNMGPTVIQARREVLFGQPVAQVPPHILNGAQANRGIPAAVVPLPNLMRQQGPPMAATRDPNQDLRGHPHELRPRRDQPQRNDQQNPNPNHNVNPNANPNPNPNPFVWDVYDARGMGRDFF